MKNKRIVFTAPYVVELQTEDVPHLCAGEVLVKLCVSTISPGTERANLIGDPNVALNKVAPFPRRGGYSAAGIVAAVGEGVRSVSVGDRVACVNTNHSQYCVLKEDLVFPMENSISMREAALTHISIFPLAAIRKCRLEIGESAIVMGLGLLGLLGVMELRAAGAVPIIAVDPIQSKREQALSLGADYALDPFAPDFAQTVKQLTGGGASVALEITGKGQGLDMVLDCMAPFGRVALLGCTRSSDFSIDYYRKVHGPGITLVGAHTNARPKQESSAGLWTRSDDCRTILRMLAQKRLNFSLLLDELHKPEEAVEVFRRLSEEPSFPVVQFDWREGEEIL